MSRSIRIRRAPLIMKPLAMLRHWNRKFYNSNFESSYSAPIRIFLYISSLKPKNRWNICRFSLKFHNLRIRDTCQNFRIVQPSFSVRRMAEFYIRETFRFAAC